MNNSRNFSGSLTTLNFAHAMLCQTLHIIIQHFLFFHTTPQNQLLVYGGKNVTVTWPCLAFHSPACDNMVHHTACRQLRLYSVHLTTYICTEDNEINSDDGIS